MHAVIISCPTFTDNHKRGWGGGGGLNYARGLLANLKVELIEKVSIAKVLAIAMNIMSKLAVHIIFFGIDIIVISLLDHQHAKAEVQ